MAERIKATDLGELAEGDMKALEGAERTVVILNVGGDLYAIDDECTHSGCPLSAGDLEGESLECSCHGSVFNVRTGAVEQGPAEDPIPTYQVSIEGDGVYVSI